MRICFICKYPPIEGGESSKAYWLVKALGKAGNNVYVVTNSWNVENRYRECISPDDIDYYQPKGVKVFNTNPFQRPKFIPSFKCYTEELSTLAIDVINRYNAELIDSWYILPYGIAGFITKNIINKPLLLRHAGSDISRLFESPNLNTLFKEIIKRADKIITYPSMIEFFSGLGVPKNNIFLNRISVDTEAFNPNVKPFDLSKYTQKTDIPIITYIGKVGISKGIFDLIKALSKVKEDFIFLLVTNKTKELENCLKQYHIENKSIILGFIPCWKIPSIMKLSTCIVMPERDFEVKIHTPILFREAAAVGTCTIMSNELFNKRAFEIENNVHTLTVNPKESKEFTSKLEFVIKNPDKANEIGKEAHSMSKKIENFNYYVKSINGLYKEVLGIK